MVEKLNILVANPAGNKTIFVLDKCRRDKYTELGTKLLAIEEIHGEQVGFIKPPEKGGQGRMEMCGQEFCGNASRSFGLYLAKQVGVKGFGKVQIEVSGTDELLEVEVDTYTDYTKLSMPLPTGIKAFPLNIDAHAKLVLSSGIVHVVVFNLQPTIENFTWIKSEVLAQYDPPGIGVMFYDTIKKSLTPVVWVRDIDSTFFEGSCGSGSVATAAVLAEDTDNGNLVFKLPQPGGILEINIIKENGLIIKAFLQGEISLGVPVEIELP